MPTFLSTRDRSRAGITATIVNKDTGETEVIVRHGYEYQTGQRATRTIHRLGNKELLNDLCEELRARVGHWRIRTISTPDSIITDLNGRATEHQDAEARLLTVIDAMDLLEREAL